jgi:exodeoxyribonuclease-5
MRAPNLHTDTLFVVDEASMISNESPDRPVFGNGALLDDLIEYVYSGYHCRLILMGDSAQLPPVSLTASPALNEEYLKRYHLQVTAIQLRQVVRQQEDSGILVNATHLRQALDSRKTETFPQILTRQFADIRQVDGAELIEEISSAYSRDGVDNTIIICRSNKKTNIYNNGVRNRILYREEELSSGDRLMIVKNNYYWGKEQDDVDFIANGEIVQVLRVRNSEEMYGFRFGNVRVRFIDYDLEMDCKILLDTLHSESPALSKEAGEKLYAAVAETYADVKLKSERHKMIRDDPYFNALQVKYAYAITCHKAQGGQWNNVFLDIGYITGEMLGEDFYRWLYTAFTRATQRLYLVNFCPRISTN